MSRGQFVPLAEACEILCISKRTAYRLVKQAVLRRTWNPYSPGKVCFLRRDIERLSNEMPVVYLDEMKPATAKPLEISGTHSIDPEILAGRPPISFEEFIG